MESIIAQLDAQIDRLTRARALLQGGTASVKKRGLHYAKQTSPTPKVQPKRNRVLSAKGRKAISDAMKARWAKKKAGKN